MNAETRVKILDRARFQLPTDTIVDYLIEESAELIHALSKWKRGKSSSIEKIEEEMADVSIMLELAKGTVVSEGKVTKQVEKKLKRLRRRTK